MITLISVVGVPACGKSTLMKAFMNSISFVWSRGKEGLVVWEEHGKYRVLGVYDYGQTFCGTDKLSMAVQPEALKWLRRLAEKGENLTILFEGDRLSSRSFLRDAKAIEGVELKIVVLECEERELSRRHKERADTQDETWLKGRVSKVSRVKEAFRNEVIELQHENKSDTKKCVEKLMELVGEGG